MNTEMETEKKWFVCEETGKKFQFPNGAQCYKCKRMVCTEQYLYSEMDPVCLKCHKKDLEKMMNSLKPADD